MPFQGQLVRRHHLRAHKDDNLIRIDGQSRCLRSRAVTGITVLLAGREYGCAVSPRIIAVPVICKMLKMCRRFFSTRLLTLSPS